MPDDMNRRQWMGAALAAGAVAAAVPAGAASAGAPATTPASAPGDGSRAVPAPAASLVPPPPPSKFQLGLISYNIGAAWDLPTMLKSLSAAGIKGVEFRTTHAHKVEPALSPDARADVKKRCADAGVTPVALGSVAEFHSPDPAVVARNVEDCRAFVKLAADIGAKGVKVRPNGLPAQVPVPKTLEQIGKALVECGKAAADAGVQIFVEVHGKGTQDPPHFETLMKHGDHPAVRTCWNSNPTDLADGTIADAWTRLSARIGHVHINELISGYPYGDLFGRLRGIGYDGWTMIEIGRTIPEKPGAKEPEEAVRFLKYYRMLWQQLVDHGGPGPVAGKAG